MEDIAGAVASSFVDWFREVAAGSVPSLLILVALLVSGLLVPRPVVDELRRELSELRKAEREREQDDADKLKVTSTAAITAADVVAQVLRARDRDYGQGGQAERETRGERERTPP